MKRLLLIALFILIPAASMAKIGAGIKVGYVASQLSYDESEIEEGFLSAPQLGIFAKIGKAFFLQPEINWTNKGGQYKGGDINLNTIDLVPLVGVRLIDLKAVNFNIHAGPVASILTEADLVGSADELEDSEFSDFMWSFQAGVGVEALGSFSLDIRYEAGLNDLYDAASEQRTDFEAIPSRFVITLGWKIFNF